MKISKIIHTLISPPKFAKAILGKATNIIYYIRNRQRKFRFGNENSDLKFYMIGFNCGWSGLAWITMHVIKHLEYADDKNYVPIVDLRGFKSQYVADEDSDKDNLWEYWFEQPAGYDTEGILKSRNIIKSQCTTSPGRRYDIDHFDYKNKSRMGKARRIYNKYVKLNEGTLKLVLEMRDRLVGDKKVLGVMCRGTDYLKIKPNLHPIQPDPQDVINEAVTVMKKYGCSHVFLSTEDKDIYDLFHKRFGNALLSIPQTRFSKTDISDDISLSKLSGFDIRRNIAFSYLASMYILSKCPCFIGGITGGSQLVMIMNDDFEYTHLWDLGAYAHDRSLKEYWKDFIDELFGVRERA